MFSFLQRSRVRLPSPALRRAVAAGGLPPGLDPATLRVIESRGTYAGRRVTYVHVFDSRRAAELGLIVKEARDLNGRPDLVLATGHVEQEGDVVLNSRPDHARVPPTARQAADRAAHADDERFVFPDGPAPCNESPDRPAPSSEGRPSA